MTLALLAALSASAQIAPPLKKVWEQQLKGQIENAEVVGDRIYFGTWDDFGALDRKTGKPLFVVSNGKDPSGAEVTLSGDTLYVAVGQQKLLACDPKTGKVRWSVPSSYYGVKPLIVGGRVLETLREGFVSAVGIREHKPLWTVDLHRPQPKSKYSSKMYGPSALAQLDANRVLVGTHDAEVFCLSAATGKRLWKTSFKLPEYRGEISSITVGAHVFVTNEEGIVALEPGTGRILWRFTKEMESFDQLVLGPGGTLFGLADSGTLYCLDAQTGKFRWSQRLSKASHIIKAPLALGAGGILVGMDDSLQAISPTGKALWTWSFPNRFFEAPFFVSSSDLIIAGASKFYCYVPGQPPGLPATAEARRALARNLAARLKNLTEDETRALDSLGDEAFEVLFPMVQNRLADYLSKQEKKTKDSFNAYSMFSDTMQALGRATQPKYTASIIGLLKQAEGREGKDQSVRAVIFQILAGESARMIYAPEGRSDPKLIVPLFLKELEKGESSGGFGSALYYIFRSAHPDALAFLKAAWRTRKPALLFGRPRLKTWRAWEALPMCRISWLRAIRIVRFLR
ncbi:MAG: PQQ-binding-like beta-propeller repeat protein [Armatimonas sp.]